MGWPRRAQRRETFLLPNAPEVFNRRWGVPGEMIIGESVDENASFSDLVAKINPTAQFGCAVHDCFVPGHGLLFDCFAITEPADVGPASRNRIELKCGRTRHPGTVLEYEGNAAVTE